DELALERLRREGHPVERTRGRDLLADDADDRGHTLPAVPLRLAFLRAVVLDKGAADLRRAVLPLTEDCELDELVLPVPPDVCPDGALDIHQVPAAGRLLAHVDVELLGPGLLPESARDL